MVELNVTTLERKGGSASFRRVSTNRAVEEQAASSAYVYARILLAPCICVAGALPTGKRGRPRVRVGAKPPPYLQSLPPFSPPPSPPPTLLTLRKNFFYDIVTLSIHIFGLLEAVHVTLRGHELCVSSVRATFPFNTQAINLLAYLSLDLSYLRVHFIIQFRVTEVLHIQEAQFLLFSTR